MQNRIHARPDWPHAEVHRRLPQWPHEINETFIFYCYISPCFRHHGEVEILHIWDRGDYLACHVNIHPLLWNYLSHSMFVGLLYTICIWHFSSPHHLRPPRSSTDSFCYFSSTWSSAKTNVLFKHSNHIFITLLGWCPVLPSYLLKIIVFRHHRGSAARELMLFNPSLSIPYACHAIWPFPWSFQWLKIQSRHN